MIAIIVPVHNEEALLEQCLNSIRVATQHAHFALGYCKTYVVLDTCSDRSAEIAECFDVTILKCAVRSVGAARDWGAARAIADGAVWLATTDADTCVSPDWLRMQISIDADAVCGTIGVDWPDELAAVRTDFENNYVDADDHRHIHGANLGVSVAAYMEAGGFAGLNCHEDVALVKALIKIGKRVVWSAAPRVVTSARTIGRAPAGFANDIARFMEMCSTPAPNPVG